MVITKTESKHLTTALLAMDLYEDCHRQTGRTEKMLNEIIKKNHSGNFEGVVIVCHSYIMANHVKQRLIDLTGKKIGPKDWPLCVSVEPSGVIPNTHYFIGEIPNIRGRSNLKIYIDHAWHFMNDRKSVKNLISYHNNQQCFEN